MITFLKDSMKTVQSKMKFNIENIDTFLENMILHKFENIKIDNILRVKLQESVNKYCNYD